MSDKTNAPEKVKISAESIANQLMTVTNVHLNTSQEVIITTEDKVQLCLTNHLKRMEKKRDWIAPLGIFLTIVITFFTTSFKSVGSFSVDTVKALFVISGVLSFAWLFKSVITAWKSEKIEDIVQELKKGSIKTKS